MIISNMEHYDKFDNEYVCWVEVKDIPDKFILEAKRIDKENYSPDCFGICVGKDETEWYVCQDTLGCELYYVDNNGEKHWLKYILSDNERNEAIEYCKCYVKEYEI